MLLIYIKHCVEHLVFVPATTLYFTFQMIGNSTFNAIPVKPDVVDMRATAIREFTCNTATILVLAIGSVLCHTELWHKQTITLVIIVVCIYFVILTTCKCQRGTCQKQEAIKTIFLHYSSLFRINSHSNSCILRYCVLRHPAE